MVDQLYTGAEVASMLKVTTAWVRAHANGNRQPVLPSIKMGKERRFRASDLAAFLKMCEKCAQMHIAQKGKRSAA